jgi:hypothetical protein
VTKEERREATRIRIEARKERIAKLLLNIKRTQQPRFLVSGMNRERLFDGSSPSPLAAPPGGE